MNQNMKFIFGLIVGFFICYFLTKNDNHSEKKPQAKSQTEETVVSEHNFESRFHSITNSSFFI